MRTSLQESVEKVDKGGSYTPRLCHGFLTAPILPSASPQRLNDDKGAASAKTPFLVTHSYYRNRLRSTGRSRNRTRTRDSRSSRHRPHGLN